MEVKINENLVQYSNKGQVRAIFIEDDSVKEQFL